MAARSRSSVGPHSAEVAAVRLQQRLESIGSTHVTKSLLSILQGGSTEPVHLHSDDKPRAAASSSAGSRHDVSGAEGKKEAATEAGVKELVERSVRFARQAGFLHDEVRLTQFLDIVRAVSAHVACSATGSRLQTLSPASHSHSQSQAQAQAQAQSQPSASTAETSSSPLPTRSKRLFKAEMKINTSKVPQPDTPRSRRHEGSSPTSAVSPTRIRPTEPPERLLDIFRAFVGELPAKEARLQGAHLVTCVLRRLLPNQPLIDALKARYTYLRTNDFAFQERVHWIRGKSEKGCGTTAWVAGMQRLRDIFWGHWVLEAAHLPVASILFDFVACLRGFTRSEMLPVWNEYEKALASEVLSPESRSEERRTSSQQLHPRAPHASYNCVVAGAETRLQRARDAVVLKWALWAREGLEQELQDNTRFMFDLRFGHMPGVLMEFTRLWEMVVSRWCLDTPQINPSPRSLQSQQKLEQARRPISPTFPRTSLSPRLATSPRMRSPRSSLGAVRSP